jgi:ATP-binding cassette, subfamily B, bacterial
MGEGVVERMTEEKNGGVGKGGSSERERGADVVVVMEGVTARYADSAPLVLDSFALSVARGEQVALVGESGCGKSTALRILLGALGYEGGSVRVLGREVKECGREDLLRNVGVVPQQSFLFAGSIADNISMGRPGGREAVERAARLAEIHDAIVAMPRGYDTLVGDGRAGKVLTGGADVVDCRSLSGGQAQRVCIARVLYNLPTILLLDEATSALDGPTAKALMETLLRVCRQQCITSIQVSHTLPLLHDVDRIVVLDRGRVAEQGTFDQLVAQGRASRFVRLLEHESLDEAVQLRRMNTRRMFVASEEDDAERTSSTSSVTVDVADKDWWEVPCDVLAPTAANAALAPDLLRRRTAAFSWRGFTLEMTALIARAAGGT